MNQLLSHLSNRPPVEPAVKHGSWTIGSRSRVLLLWGVWQPCATLLPV